MKKQVEILYNSKINEYNKTYKGFSFVAFIYPPIWYLIKGMFVHFIIFQMIYASILVSSIYLTMLDTEMELLIFVLNILFIIPINILCGLKSNQWYKEVLCKNGYKIYNKEIIEKKNQRDLSDITILTIICVFILTVGIIISLQ